MAEREAESTIAEWLQLEPRSGKLFQVPMEGASGSRDLSRRKRSRKQGGVTVSTAFIFKSTHHVVFE